MSWRFESAEKLDGMSPENVFDERSMYRSVAGMSEEILPERKL